MNMVQKRRRVLWAKAHLKWTVSKSGKVSKLYILVGNHGRCILKRRETFQPVVSVQFKSQYLLIVWGCVSAYCMGSLHFLEGTMNAERYIKVLEQHMLPSR